NFRPVPRICILIILHVCEFTLSPRRENDAMIFILNSGRANPFPFQRAGLIFQEWPIHLQSSWPKISFKLCNCVSEKHTEVITILHEAEVVYENRPSFTTRSHYK